jgi:hypothetical protein
MVPDFVSNATGSISIHRDRRMISRIHLLLILGLAGALAPFAWADGAPSTAPATRSAVRHVAVIPPGYHVVVVGDRKIICRPADDVWVSKIVMGPATRPTTMPSDILADIQQKRGDILQQAAADLAMADTKPLNDAIDSMIPEVNKLVNLNPTVYYFPITRKNLTDLVAGGWSDPRFLYIRYAHQVVFDGFVTVTTDRPMDDLINWVEITDDQTPAEKMQVVAENAGRFDYEFQKNVSIFAQSGVRNVLADFILANVAKPLKVAPTENWFETSLSEIYAIKYASRIIGSSRWALTRALLIGDPRNPIEWEPLDLVHPLDPGSMRPEFENFYDNAVIRKGAFVLDALITKGGDGVLAKAIVAMRATAPANAADLIRIILQTSGIDPTPVMLPFYSPVPPQL